MNNEKINSKFLYILQAKNFTFKETWSAHQLLVILFIITLIASILRESTTGINVSSLLILCTSILARNLTATPIPFFYIFYNTLFLILPKWITHLPPLNLFTAVMATSSLLFLLFPKHSMSDYFKLGKVNQFNVLMIIIISLAAALSLLIWANSTNYMGVGRQLVLSYAHFHSVIVNLLLLGFFAICNATAEEMTYRGLLQTTFMYLFEKNKYIPIVLQASLFGVAHYHYGFPNGWVGLLMTFCYGILLGCLRITSKGLLSPIITHISADYLIGIILYLSATHIAFDIG